MATRRKKPTTDALAILDKRFFGGRRDIQARYEEESANLDVARRIYELRTKAGLTQAALAKLVSTTRSVISRLEDADYDGHSLSMLRRIAAALNQRIDIRFLPVSKKHRAA